MPTPRVPLEDQYGCYFVTMTVIEWINIFTKKEYFDLLAQSFQFCIDHKGLLLYEYVFMTNHLHCIMSAEEKSEGVSRIIQDLKRHTTAKMKIMLHRDNRQYIMTLLEHSYAKKYGTDFQIWQRENYPEMISSEQFRNVKIQYIWQNPVTAGYVLHPEDWLYSSARQKLLGLKSDHEEIKIPCLEW